MRFALLAAAALALSAPHSSARPVHHAPPKPAPTYYTIADPNGSYYVLTHINGRPYLMMVDTGASDVNVSEKAAKWMGLPDGGEITTYILADNSTQTCRTVLAETIQVGEVVARDVRVAICKEPSPLLGTSFINKVRMTVEDGHLIFRNK